MQPAKDWAIAAVEYSPTAQLLHVPANVALWPLMYWPAAQLVQPAHGSATLVDEDWKVPDAQASQLPAASGDAPLLEVPAAHVVQGRQEVRPSAGA